MKFTINWLKEHLETKSSDEDIINKLTAIGLEVEEVKDAKATYGDFLIAQVINEEKHPNADKLKLCKVDVGGKVVDVVCGAPNVVKGMKVVYAPPGAVIPINQMQLKVVKIRGIESSGMLCSEYELGISDAHDGIIQMPEDSNVGALYVDQMNLNNVMIEIGITPNRQDCLGVHGIARDLAAAGMGELKKTEIPKIKTNGTSPINVLFEEKTDEKNYCPAFGSRYIKNVKNCESPQWLKDKLNSIGLKPISALVDVTNYILFDFNRPLHVYDADKVSGNIIIRSAKKDEKFLGLDDKEYTLEKGMCVIADEKKPLGLGGILGGSSSACDMATTNVLLESALFIPSNIANTGRKLFIDSDARYRFERGVDPNSLNTGLDKAASLIQEICGGEISETQICGTVIKNEQDISFDLVKNTNRLGVEIDQSEIEQLLKKLGIKIISKKNNLICTIPSWRQDIHGEADLSEEVVRLKGFDSIPVLSIRPEKKINETILSDSYKNSLRSKRFLAQRGINELITWSFASSKDSKFYIDDQTLNIKNPISEELDVLRPSLIPNLLGAVKKNNSRGFESFSLFEVGNQFFSDQSGDQKNIACGLRSGIKSDKNWRNEKSYYDAYDVQEDILSLVEHLIPQSKKIEITSGAPKWYHPGRSATIMLNKNTVLGYFGELHPKIIKYYKIKTRISVFELFLDEVPSRSKKSTNKESYLVSDFQAVDRDFAFIIDREVEGKTLVSLALKADEKLVKNAEIFDVFEGDSIGVNKKSLAIKVTMQAFDRTLNEAEIQEVSTKIVNSIQQNTSGVVRS